MKHRNKLDWKLKLLIALGILIDVLVALRLAQWYFETLRIRGLN